MCEDLPNLYCPTCLVCGLWLIKWFGTSHLKEILIKTQVSTNWPVFISLSGGIIFSGGLIGMSDLS